MKNFYGPWEKLEHWCLKEEYLLEKFLKLLHENHVFHCSYVHDLYYTVSDCTSIILAND